MSAPNNSQTINELRKQLLHICHSPASVNEDVEAIIILFESFAADRERKLLQTNASEIFAPFLLWLNGYKDWGMVKTEILLREYIAELNKGKS